MIGSSPLVGSSNINTDRFCIKAIISPNFCFVPLDILFIFILVSNSKIVYKIVKSVFWNISLYLYHKLNKSTTGHIIVQERNFSG